MRFNRTQFSFCLAVFLGLVCAIYYSDFSIFITYFSFLLLGVFLFRKQQSTVRGLQKTSFFVNVSAAVIVTLCFELIHGTWYSAGNDDLSFYSIAVQLSKGANDFYLGSTTFDWGAVQYKLYVLVFSVWYRLLNAIGIHGNFFFHLNVINAFVGSLIAPFVYKIGLKLFNDGAIAKKAALVCLFFPPLIYYSSIINRDSWVVSFFLMIVYLVLANIGLVKKMMLIALVTVAVLYLRKSSGFFMALFVFLYFIFNSRNKYVLFFVSNIAPVGALFILTVFLTALQIPPPKEAPPITDFLTSISYTVDKYRELTLNEATDGSIGLRLRLSNNPLVLFFYYIYVYLGPIPPKFLKDFNLVNVFLGLGNLLWYVLSPLYFIHSFQLRKTDIKIFVRAFFWFLMVLLIMVATSTGEQRHLLFIYPIVLLFATDYVMRHKNHFILYLAFFTFLALAGLLAYLFLKIVL